MAASDVYKRQSMYSGLAGGMALSILMLPTVIKTTDEGLKLVPNELRYASLGVGASMYTTILKAPSLQLNRCTYSQTGSL